MTTADIKASFHLLRSGKLKSKMKCIFMFGLIQSILIFPVVAQGNVDSIIKAYEKRISGKVDEAIAILNTVIKNDSTNAMAYFEMARATSDENKDFYIKKALHYDPNNAMYKFFNANLYMLSAYKAIQMNESDSIMKNVQKCTKVLKSILELDPNCKESLLFLVDLYGSLPKEMGGDIEQANIYIDRLKTVDQLYGAKGRSILLSKETDFDIIKYWQKFIETHGESAEALINLGKANLLKSNIDDATLYFNKAIAIDTSQNQLYLDIARAHLYNAMRGDEQKNNELIKLKKNINRYLETKEHKPVIIKAWCYGWLGKAEEILGHKTKSRKYLTKAEKLFPNFPKYTAIPAVDNPPNSNTYKYKSYFTPF